jgi:hypothetical protein
VASRDAQAMLGSARTREEQNWWLAQAVVLGVLAGLILFPLLGSPIARNLPFWSLPDRLATAALSVWSRDEVVRVDFERGRVFGPGIADGLKGRSPL